MYGIPSNVAIKWPAFDAFKSYLLTTGTLISLATDSNWVYDNSFNEISNELKNKDIVFSKLFGSSGRISNIIQKYTNNEIKVLLLNAKHFGSGLNLQMTSDIIIYHRMTNDLEKQVIGRGQRMGRTSPLNIHYLCYDNELW